MSSSNGFPCNMKNKHAFSLAVYGAGTSILREYRTEFLEATTKTLLSVTGIPRIRLQQLAFQMDANNVYVLGTLLDSPPAICKSYY